MRRFTPLLLLLSAAPVAAQTQSVGSDHSALARAAATITESDVARRVGIIAHDSMQGRDTPSRGLDLTAQYVADQFKSFGLKPGGENGTWFQRYPITRRILVTEKSEIRFTAGSATVNVGLSEAARFAFGSVPKSAVTAEMVVLGGAIDPTAAQELPVKDKVAVLVPDYSDQKALGQMAQVARAIRAAGPAALVMVVNLDSAAFRTRMATQTRERTVIDLGEKPLPMLEVHEAALAGFAKAAGLDFAAIRSSTTPVVKPLGTATVSLTERVVSSQTAPNTIGILEGSDPALRNEYLVYTAHMDHVGVAGNGSCQAKGADSICNGADDDASGTVGVIELAEAFSREGARPRRSIIFMTVSGEEKGLWGSHYFSEHPTVPLEQMVANINLDMIGRNWADTIVAIGKEHSDLGATLNRVNAEHPELGMTAIDDMWPEERFYFRSDHFNFARKGVPVLFFFNGVHDDYHQVSDHPDKIGAEKESRILKLLFYVGQEVANATERPKWNPESYEEIVEK